MYGHCRNYQGQVRRREAAALAGADAAVRSDGIAAVHLAGAVHACSIQAHCALSSSA